ncbi:MAG: DUF3592 domain-containing protein [Clostridia bacterium]|nr:DUF3592 domain-containing protein [Clostridia bacterium]
MYIGIAVIAVVIVGGFVYSYLRSKKIKENGVEADAVVSRIKEIEKEDENGHHDYDYEYYVRYTNQAGETVEARLGNAPRFLQEGTQVRIKYLPEKPKYALMLKK